MAGADKIQNPQLRHSPMKEKAAVTLIGDGLPLFENDHQIRMIFRLHDGQRPFLAWSVFRAEFLRQLAGPRHIVGQRTQRSGNDHMRLNKRARSFSVNRISVGRPCGHV